METIIQLNGSDNKEISYDTMKRKNEYLFDDFINKKMLHSKLDSQYQSDYEFVNDIRHTNQYLQQNQCTNLNTIMINNSSNDYLICESNLMGNLVIQNGHNGHNDTMNGVKSDSINYVQSHTSITQQPQHNSLSEMEHWNNTDLLDLDQNISYNHQQPQQNTVPGNDRNNYQQTSDGHIVTHIQTYETDQSGSTKKSITNSGTNAFNYTQQPQYSSSEDYEDKNLSWLFNFKLDKLPHLSPEVNNRSRTSHTNKKFDQNQSEYCGQDQDTEDPLKIFNTDYNGGESNTNVTLKKPPFTYTELIEYALEDKGELTVSGIYQWISDRFPFYKSNDDRWKNSVRHNLSINPHFRKGNKAPQGAGHLWTISSHESEVNSLAWEHKKQRLELFLKMEGMKSANKEVQKETKTEQYDETVAATTALIMNEGARVSPNNMTQYNSMTQTPCTYINDNISQSVLSRCAGEILKGVKREVEVQIIDQNNIVEGINLNLETEIITGDYLNPVSKEEIVQESGLKSERYEIIDDYFMTDANSIELDVNVSGNGEEAVLFCDDFNLNYYGIISTSGNNVIT